jgi:NAD(P)-dependent dehydrogenase (short-subunit alcohol dehydrogenase family)
MVGSVGDSEGTMEVRDRRKVPQMILVTAANGRTGRSVVRALVRAGHQVRAFDHNPQVRQLIDEGAADALVGDMLYVFSRQGDDEVATCLDAATGKERWQDKYAAQAASGPAVPLPGSNTTFRLRSNLIRLWSDRM